MSLKSRTAGAVKWNIIDRVASQVLYAVTGIVLARELSPSAFGLVGAMLVFQSFALLFVDSGFSYALIQRKEPTQTDYSSVFWFNLMTATGLYLLLWILAPVIAGWFGGDPRLVPLSRVMFLSFIINAAAIVQTNRLMKRMNVRPIAITNALGLACGGGVGIWLAVAGFEAWAIVWQTLVTQGVKLLGLSSYCRWRPSLTMSWQSIKGLFGIGGPMMLTSFLNVLFQNIYSFIIGNRGDLSRLGYYTQADKWSKMGVTSLTQVLTSSFLPALSEVQDDPPRRERVMRKMSRCTAYLLFPAMLFLAALAEPVFHLLFGTKWDASVVLFQILLVRGIFTVLNTLYNNYMLSVGRSRPIFWLELLRDSVAIVAVVAVLPYIDLSTPGNIVAGVEYLLWGQLIASVVTWIVTVRVCAHVTGVPVRSMLADILPYIIITLPLAAGCWWVGQTALSPLWGVAIGGVAAVALYIAVNALAGSRIQRDILTRRKP